MTNCLRSSGREGSREAEAVGEGAAGAGEAGFVLGPKPEMTMLLGLSALGWGGAWGSTAKGRKARRDSTSERGRHFMEPLA